MMISFRSLSSRAVFLDHTSWLPCLLPPSRTFLTVVEVTNLSLGQCKAFLQVLDNKLDRILVDGKDYVLGVGIIGLIAGTTVVVLQGIYFIVSA